MTNAAADTIDWEELKELLRWLARLFGDPKRLYEDQVVRKSDGFIIRGWLAGLEAIVRVLLLEMAARLPRPQGTRKRADAKKKSAVRKPGAPVADIILGVIDAPDSERWADVSFALLPPLRRKRKRKYAKAAGLPSSLIRTRPLAFRFEALLRVARRPERYAARLARRLHADPNLASRLLRQPKPIGCLSHPRLEPGRAEALGRMARSVFAANTG